MPPDLIAIDPSYPRIDALFGLVRDVYTSTEQMSETLAERFPAPAALEAEIGAVTRRPGALFLVAEADFRPQGYLVLRPRPQARLAHTADLQMGVHSAARGQGIGHRLLAAALARSAASGIVEIVYLMVRADNRSALALYESAGFDRVATLDRDTRVDGRYFDGVLMRRWVRPPVDRAGH
jgi:ribosomal protein S18 acetylase RimI-like enzyme